ncbi:hypothetical protein LMG33818_001495 [Halomonadaceae bacterium LMG 33818]|uniref:helix-turn-helix domain-containing protein n=1 Tax=Cernens ardua TaxID=3402176 RepID=UPI003EDC466C
MAQRDEYKVPTQCLYKNEKRSPDPRAGIDVGYVLTGQRYDVGQLTPVDADRFARVARFTALTIEQLGKQASVDIVARIIVERMSHVWGVPTVKELAKELGISANTIGNWKTRGSIPISECMAISEAHNVSLDWLLEGDETFSKVPKSGYMSIWFNGMTLGEIEDGERISRSYTNRTIQGLWYRQDNPG